MIITDDRLRQLIRIVSGRWILERDEARDIIQLLEELQKERSGVLYRSSAETGLQSHQGEAHPV